MPELPEVESVRRSLAPALVGRVIERATLRRADILTGRRTAAAMLQGQTIASIDRRGKLLWLTADSGRILAVHLGMSGQLLLADTAAALPSHTHAVWTVAGSGPAHLLFRDPRRFGGLWTSPDLATFTRDRLSTLGPDALCISAADLGSALKHTKRAIKAVLLDQGVLAGVGNIYADEALFRAGIHPLARADRIRGEAVDALASAIREILTAAVSAGGSTLRDYVNAQGQSGSYAKRHLVYGRAGQACTRCSQTLRQTLVAQRTTVFCATCQKRA